MSVGEIDLATFDELKQVSGGDFIVELVDTFLDEAPKLIDQMRSALKAADSESFRRAAHSLKSNAATFGAQRLAEQAKALELIGKENRLAETGSRIDELEEKLRIVAAELRGLGR